MLNAGRLSTFRLEFPETAGTSCGASRFIASISPDWSACRRAVESEIGRMITRLSFAFVPQYLSLRTRTSLSPTLHDSSLNAPVPIGCSVPNVPCGRITPSDPIVAASARYLTSAVGLAIPKFESASAARNDDDGRLRMIRAVDAFTTLQPWYRLLSGPGFPVAGFAYPPKTVNQ